MEFEAIKLEGEENLQQVELMKELAIKEVLKYGTITVLFLLLGLVFLSLRILDEFMIILAVCAWCGTANYGYQAYLAFTQGTEEEGLLITNYRAIHYFERKTEIINFRDYHYEFFEKTQIDYIGLEAKLPITGIILCCLSVVLVVYFSELLEELGLLFPIITAIVVGAVYLGLNIYFKKTQEETVILIKIQLTSGNTLSFGFKMLSKDKQDVLIPAHTLVKASREYICQTHNY